MTEPAVTLPPRATDTRRPLWITAALFILTIVYLRWQGRVWWCAAGDLSPVSLNINSEHNSQHLLDPYLLSHVLHGMLFFGLLWIFSDRLGLAWRFLIATAIELVWEMMENSPIVIDRYRNGTVSLGYTGDSVINSIGDILGYALGFFVARRIGLWWSVAVIIGVELAMLFWMRDNLTLNVLMLLWPIDAIRRWQSGG
ncbi:MAG TPA: DUF2585 family protein [Tepidisphaeraceae bacterium]|jgi:hypothetical protein